MRHTVTDMSENETPHFPTTAPDVFGDPAWVTTVTDRLFVDLARLVDVDASRLEGPTPCADFTVAGLRDHVVGWAQRFADSLSDEEGVDPDSYHAGPDAPEVVRAAGERIGAAVRSGALESRHLVSAATMDGTGVAGMLVGEYLTHGWDLGRATGQDWRPDAQACEAALGFLRGMVTPEYRGPEGMFGEEVPVPEEAPALDRLVGFTGRDPAWQPTQRSGGGAG